MMIIDRDTVVILLLLMALVGAFMWAGFAMSMLMLNRVMQNSTRPTLADPKARK